MSQLAPTRPPSQPVPAERHGEFLIVLPPPCCGDGCSGYRALLRGGAGATHRALHAQTRLRQDRRAADLRSQGRRAARRNQGVPGACRRDVADRAMQAAAAREQGSAGPLREAATTPHAQREPQPDQPTPPATNRGRLKNGAAGGDPTASPRCGARTRAGGACLQPAMANGRCRLHGGKNTGACSKAGMDRIRAAATKHGGW